MTRPRPQQIKDALIDRLRIAASPDTAIGVMWALSLVVAVTVILTIIRSFLELPPIVITYLIPVLIAATRWGFVPAMTAMVAGAACAAFFFYKPFHTFYVEDPARRLGLLLFVTVSVVTSYLAVRMRRESENVRKREKEIRDLYAFSRRLAGGTS